MYASSKKLNGQTLAAAAVMALLVVSVVAPEHALAGTGGTEFDSVWTTLSDWMQGTLGKIAAGAMILVGIIAGVARQSLMAFAVGIGGGVGLYNTPTIIDNVLSATLANVPAATDAVVTISNGLGM